MTKKGWRRMGWITLGLVVVAASGAAMFRFAVTRNGPAVIDAVDRVAGGARGVALVHRETIGPDPQQKIAVYNAEGDEAAKPVIVFVHGGSWRSGDPDDYSFVARALAPEGFTVVLAGYRLGNGGEYPAMLQDTASAIAWTRQNVARYGGDPDAILVAGHSAGAYNVVQVALDRHWLERAGVSPSVIMGVVGLSGPYDFLPLDSDSTKAAFGDAPDLPATQPVNYLRADAPPMLLIHGEKDTLVKPRNTQALYTGLIAAGGTVTTVYFPEMDHNAPLLAMASPWRKNGHVVPAIVRFANSVAASAKAEGAAANPSVPVQATIR
ncbi:alpha/beta hydrolase [Allopontixanthobacter sediminis]|uniref:Alpha/beta hydrolase fold domain-containing protein n=1 Tax=Allopontixanthobacter sediminis TaxID=1689985 RepID=A0A845B4R8_9SPHN|nr:alpha/beta hydrolase [Allopontixanthobacter sediminis]MXP44532.1 alpha/beta hydrolase fold domain-containing protein [Allopontixanthobacter sediminis]